MTAYIHVQKTSDGRRTVIKPWQITIDHDGAEYVLDVLDGHTGYQAAQAWAAAGWTRLGPRTFLDGSGTRRRLVTVVRGERYAIV